MSAETLREAAGMMRVEARVLAMGPPWHPTVALAVADLLDNAANRAGAAFGPKSDDTDTDALKIARLYLGESA